MELKVKTTENTTRHLLERLKLKNKTKCKITTKEGNTKH